MKFASRCSHCSYKIIVAFDHVKQMAIAWKLWNQAIRRHSKKHVYEIAKKFKSL